MGRAVVSLGLWLAAAAGALGTAFFVAMLLTPGYGDAVIAVFAAVCALVLVAAVAGLRRLGRGRRARERALVAEVEQGRLLEEVAPRRRLWLTVSCAAGVFVLAGGWLVLTGSAGGLLAIAFFGPVLLLSLLQLSPSGAWLRVTTRGIVVRHMARERAHRWEDVDGFGVYEVSSRWSTQRLVGWHVPEHAQERRRVARWVRWPSGFDDGLPTEYETDADALVERLQRYRDSAVQRV